MSRVYLILGAVQKRHILVQVLVSLLTAATHSIIIKTYIELLLFTA
jgi:hypothetical protein